MKFALRDWHLNNCLLTCLAEQELEKLQQQYREMDGERRAYCEKSQNVIRKQQYAHNN